MKRKKLVIISHTEHYIDNGILKGWGSTINEINYLADYWEEITHVGCLYNSKAPASSLPYTKNNISFVPIPPFGGHTVLNKLMIAVKIPKIIFQVIKSVKNATEVQLRLPTSIGLFLLPIFTFFIPRKFTFWVKYAGNWTQQNPPLSYKLQRWWLNKNYANCKVTINGFWDNQPKHCHSFENPCLYEQDIKLGIETVKEKKINKPFSFVFVGRLETAKGVDRIINALKELPIDFIDKIHFIGDGNKTDFYKKETLFLGNKVVFHGFLEKEKVHQIFAQTHFILLPSNSEGFPKVVAEAGCYGTIPIVSNVGSIPHYINETNGFIWDINNVIPFKNSISNAINLNANDLEIKSKNCLLFAEKFTFANYINKLNLQILNK